MKKYIVSNWKMHGVSAFVDQYFNELLSLTSSAQPNIDKEIICCVPFPYLEKSVALTIKSPIKIGAQDRSNHLEGAFTGDVSAKMLTDLGVKVVLIGHSERRQYHQETAELLHQKVKCALEHGLTVIYCIGENAQQKADGQTLEILFQQCQHVLSGLHQAENLLIAYEPIWAIGTGKVPSLPEIEDVHQELGKFLQPLLGSTIPLLYGGSVTPTLAPLLMVSPFIDGLLVGKASLNPQDFNQIIG